MLTEPSLVSRSGKILVIPAYVSGICPEVVPLHCYYIFCLILVGGEARVPLPTCGSGSTTSGSWFALTY